MDEKKIAVNIYAENTPNAAAMKFVSDYRLMEKDYNLEFANAQEAMNVSPLASKIFEFPFVKSVHIKPTFITIIKNDLAQWEDVAMHMRELIRDFIRNGIPALNSEEDIPTKEKEHIEIVPETDDDMSKKIMEILDTYVKPAVESDGGTIQFKSFKDGVVNVALGGSCNGCPSTTVTLKGGVERLLTQMLPGQIKEVVSIEH